MTINASPGASKNDGSFLFLDNELFSVDLSPEFIYNDGGRSYWFKGRTGDCVTRAITISLEKNALGTPKNYKQIYNAIWAFQKKYALENNNLLAQQLKARKSFSVRRGVSSTITHLYLKNLNYDFYPDPITNEILRAEDNLIVMFKKHTSAIINGVVNDDYNPFDDNRRSLQKMYGYYKKNSEVRKKEIQDYLKKIKAIKTYDHMFKDTIKKLEIELTK
tara:strand:- start:691 stop:1347 length:657 start_codon:yes stop_codon:yes gene_type:complete